MAYTQADIRAAQVAVRAKKFAMRLETDACGFREEIPEVDQAWLQDDEFAAYNNVLRSKGCIQGADFKWESNR